MPAADAGTRNPAGLSASSGRERSDPASARLSPARKMEWRGSRPIRVKIPVLLGRANGAPASFARRERLDRSNQIGNLDDLLLNRVLHQLRLVVDIQLAHQIELVRFHRLDAKVQIA